MKTETIYFETESECDEFKKTQTCRIIKLYDLTTTSYYLILSSKYDWLNREIKPNIRDLDLGQEVYSKYCNIVKDIERCTRIKGLSQDEDEALPKLLKKFNKFRNKTRQRYD